jgi:hypothetical protein
VGGGDGGRLDVDDGVGIGASKMAGSVAGSASVNQRENLL